METLRNILETWPKIFIRDVDLAMILDKSNDARYSIIKRAFKSGDLIRLRKGLYLISRKTKKELPDEFELALLMYEPSVISLESALSYYGWIPEAVYTTTCASPKRAQKFTTPIGVFTYKRVPAPGFYVGVNRVETSSGAFLIASPWRALADLMYTQRKSWNSLEQLVTDLRIDQTLLETSDKVLLETLSKNYPSPRVRITLKKIFNEILKAQRKLS